MSERRDRGPGVRPSEDPGAGFVQTRSSWDADATYLFFKCGDRYTAHQHLDVGNFLIYKHKELVGDSGYYDTFDGDHAVNYYIRSIAHNTILVFDPDEQFKGLRNPDRTVTMANDGGQMHDWPQHNGAAVDMGDWRKNEKLYDIADMVAFNDRGSYLYVAGDCTRAYNPAKLEHFTRQIVFIRPGTFIIFDRVKSTKPEFKKTWLLQAMKTPEKKDGKLIITHGKGRLFVQTLLPESAVVKLVGGDDLFGYGGKKFPSTRVRGVVPECRVEVSPVAPAKADYFLHVLTAADSTVNSVPNATARVTDTDVTVTVGKVSATFRKTAVGGRIEIGGAAEKLATKIVVK